MDPKVVHSRDARLRAFNKSEMGWRVVGQALQGFWGGGRGYMREKKSGRAASTATVPMRPDWGRYLRNPAGEMVIGGPDKKKARGLGPI